MATAAPKAPVNGFPLDKTVNSRNEAVTAMRLAGGLALAAAINAAVALVSGVWAGSAETET